MNVGTDDHHNQQHAFWGTDHWDVVVQPPAVRQGAFYNGLSWELGYRNNWISGGWQSGTTYQIGDQILDEGWLAIANTATAERPAPQSTGAPYLPTTGATWDETNSNNTGVVDVANVYTVQQGFFTDTVFVNVIAGNIGSLHTVTLLLDDLLVSRINWTPETAGTQTLPFASTIIPAGTVVTLNLSVEKPTGNNTVFWAQDVDHWLGYSSTEISQVKGIQDGGASTDIAYGIDLIVEPATISTEWDIQAVSTSGGTQSDGTQLTTQEADWIRESTEGFDKVSGPSSGITWTPVYSLPIAPDGWTYGRIVARARRTDLQDRHVSEASYQAWRLGSGGVRCESSLISTVGGGPLIEMRVVTSMSDMVLEVRGDDPGSLWDWDLVIFKKSV
jgi:hypothetical protein